MWGTIALGPVAVLMPLLDSDTWAITLIVPITFFMSMPPGFVDYLSKHLSDSAASTARRIGETPAHYLGDEQAIAGGQSKVPE